MGAGVSRLIEPSRLEPARREVPGIWMGDDSNRNSWTLSAARAPDTLPFPNWVEAPTLSNAPEPGWVVVTVTPKNLQDHLPSVPISMAFPPPACLVWRATLLRHRHAGPRPGPPANGEGEDPQAITWEERC